MEYRKLKTLAKYPTGKLNSNAAVEDGEYPFFTCAHDIYRIDQYSYDGEYVLLGGNNASGDFPIFYYNGKFDAYQRTYLIQPLSEDTDTKYLYYSIGLKLHQMKANASGTATKFLTLPILNNINIEYRDIEEQRKIAYILSSYDNLIENNNKQIKLLEQMAENLYTEWFVRFRFPGYEKAEFENGIPKGWNVEKIKKCVKRLPFNQLYKQRDLENDGTVIVIDQSSSSFLGFHNNEPSHYASIEKPIILFGDHSCKFVLMIRDFSLGENVVPFITADKNELDNYYLYYAVHKLIYTEEYKRHWGRFTAMKIFVPQYQLQKSFSDVVKPMIEEKQKLWNENQLLIKQRDMLLPRLMSGKLKV